ncbi:MAG: hypothetical protein FD168_1985 [Desulfobulbaceae bacterium]|jgi:hypothetical protein|nr:MAG: hypothetical protein FD168_1985 [Desulfobulbaceae bacterium]
MHSLKKTGYRAFVAVAILLIVVLLLGFRQYLLTGQYNTIIRQSEESIFQFSTIRERITESLITHDWDKAAAASQDFKDLNATLVRLQESDLIPPEYKLDMAKQIDLSGLAITSRNITTTEDKVAHSLKLQNQMRTLAEYLLQFDRIIVSQMRAKVVHFQTIMIGSLGMIICIISVTLILLYQKALIPLFRLADQVSAEGVQSQDFKVSSSACAEIEKLTDTLIELSHHQLPDTNKGESLIKHNQQTAAIINEGTNLSNGIINYAQLLSDSFEESSEDTEEKIILGKIISAGERIAAILKKF